MASNSVDLIIASEAIKSVENLTAKLIIADKEILALSEHARALSKSISGISTPASLDKTISNFSQLNTQIQRQNNQIKALETQIKSLTAVKASLGQKEALEIVNGRVLEQNAIRQAKAVSNMVGQYQNLNAQHQKAFITAQNLGAQFGVNSAQFKRAAKEANELDSKLKNIDSNLGKFSRNVGNYSSAFNGLGAALGVSFGAAGLAMVAKSVFETTKELQALEKALSLVTETQANFLEQQAFIAKTSEDYGVDIKNLTQQFTKFYVASKDKLAGAEIQNIFRSITKAGASLGLSNEAVERSFLALSQMMSKGTIQSEELRGQLGDSLPGAFGILAKALDVSEVKLGKMLKNGEVLAVEALPKLAKQIEKTYGIENLNRVDSLAASQNRLTNAWIDFVKSLDEDGNKASTVFSGILDSLTYTIKGFRNLITSSQVEYDKSLEESRIKSKKSNLDYYNRLKEVEADYLEYKKTELRKENKDILEQRDLIIKTQKEIRAKGGFGGNFIRKEDAENYRKNDQQLRSYNKTIVENKGHIDAINEVLAKKNKIEKELSAEEIKKRAKAEEDRLKDRYELAKQEIELQMTKQELILNNEYAAFDKQYDALKKFQALKLMLIELDYREQVRLAKNNATLIKTAELKKEEEILKANESGFNRLKSIRRKELEERLAEIKEIEQDLKAVDEARMDRIKEREDLEKKTYLASFSRIEEEIKIQEELNELRREYIESFSGEFFTKSGFSESFNLFAKEVKDANGEASTLFKELLKGAAEAEDKLKVVFNSTAETAQETFNFINNLSQNNFDSEYSRLDAQKEMALKFAGDSASARIKIEEDYEKRKTEIAAREAKAKQKQAVFNIAIDTAQAIMATLAKEGFAGIALTAIVAAIGAAQIAAVLSEEIPQYFKGGVHDGGLAMINDAKGGNYVETVVTPDGKAKQYRGRNIVTDLPAGTEIFTPEQWKQKQIAAGLQGSNIAMQMTMREAGLKAEEMDTIMGKYFSRIQISTTVVDRHGISHYIEQNGNKTKRDNNRFAGTGFKV